MTPRRLVALVEEAVLDEPALLRLQRGDNAWLEAHVADDGTLGRHLVDDTDAFDGDIRAQAVSSAREAGDALVQLGRVLVVLKVFQLDVVYSAHLPLLLAIG
mgnify:CR=1 FL=1|jgi:hypothetical protein